MSSCAPKTNIKYAFLLAAGFGKRMNTYTRDVPKPMLKVGDIPLIVYSLYAIKKFAIENIVVNTHYKADQIHRLLKYAPFHVSISHEKKILGTAGGLKKALIEKRIPDNQNFLLLNTDLILEPPNESGRMVFPDLPFGVRSHLYLKEKDAYNKETGWDLDRENRLRLNQIDGKYYYTGFSIINPDLLLQTEPGQVASLGDLWKKASENKRITGDSYGPQIVSCGNQKEYENIKDRIPDFLEHDPEFHDFYHCLKAGFDK